MPFDIQDLSATGELPRSVAEPSYLRPQNVAPRVSSSLVKQGVGPSSGPSFGRKVIPDRMMIINYDTRDYRTFAMNPNDPTDVWGANWENMPVVGVSHPPLQYTGGDERILKFTVFYDRDMVPCHSVSIEREWAWFKHFLAPKLSGNQVAAPYRLMFIAGPMWPGDEIFVMRKVEITNVVMYPTGLIAKSASIALTLAEWIGQSRVSSEFYLPGTQDTRGGVMEEQEFMSHLQPVIGPNQAYTALSARMDRTDQVSQTSITMDQLNQAWITYRDSLVGG